MSTTWRKELDKARAKAGDHGSIIFYAPDSSAFDVEFDPGYGCSNGPRVLAWTGSRVYFPAVYDGAEWIDSAPRNPVARGQAHVGGE